MTFDRINMDAFEQELVELRRDFHRYAESGWTEFRTTARIITELEKLDLPVKYGPEIHVKEKMYGLPKPEVLNACWQRALGETDHPELVRAMEGGYTGCITEIDGALPGPIGAAKLLAAYRDQLRGKVILVFQPGEEGLRGAASLTAKGHFSNCDYFFGGHVGLLDGHDIGTVCTSGHGFLCSTKFDIAIHGVPSHAGAAPEAGCNALASAATAALNMLAIPRHHEGASRINIGTLRAGSGRNVIPGEAEMTVETRGKTVEINQFMYDSAIRVCKAAAEMYGCTMESRFMGSAGNVDCDPEAIALVRRVLEHTEGVTKIVDDVDFSGGEDVTTMMRDVQAHGGKVTEMIFCMPLKAPHHNDFFDVDERVIPLGARIFAGVALAAGEEA